MNKLITAHEEQYSDGRVFGIFLEVDENTNNKVDSYPYIFRESDNVSMYIFFETIMDMNDYLLYGNDKVKRAYMKEDKFDHYYDNPYSQSFSEILKWT